MSELVTRRPGESDAELWARVKGGPVVNDAALIERVAAFRAQDSLQDLLNDLKAAIFALKQGTGSEALLDRFLKTIAKAEGQ